MVSKRHKEQSELENSMNYGQTKQMPGFVAYRLYGTPDVRKMSTDFP